MVQSEECLLCNRGDLSSITSTRVDVVMDPSNPGTGEVEGEVESGKSLGPAGQPI